MKPPALLAAVCAAAVSVFAPTRSGAQDTDNAALLYYQAICDANPLTLSDKTFLLRKSTDPLDEAAAEAILRPRKHSLDLVERASKKPTCDWGLNLDEGPTTPPTRLSRLQEITDVLRLRARLRLQRGEIDAATDDLVTMLRFSRHVGEPALLLAQIGQFIAQGFAVQTVADHLPKFSDADLARLAETLRTLPPGHTLPEMLRTEKHMVADWLNRLVDQSLEKHESEEEAKWYQAIVNPVIVLEPENAATFHPANMEEAVRAARALPQDYDELIRLAETPEPPPWTALHEFTERARAGKTASPLAATMMPPCEAIARREAEYRTLQAMLLAAIEARLSHGGREALAKQSRDLYGDGAPFEVREVDGGVELRSKLIGHGDRPVTLRCAW